MAHHQDAKKRMRQNAKRRAHNRHYRSTMRTAIKVVRASLETGDVAAAEAALPSAVSVIQTLVGKKIIHRNQGNRRVARLQAAVNRAKPAS